MGNSRTLDPNLTHLKYNRDVRSKFETILTLVRKDNCCHTTTRQTGPYKRTLTAALHAYPGGTGVHEGAGVDQRNIKKLLFYPGASSAPAIYIDGSRAVCRIALSFRDPK